MSVSMLQLVLYPTPPSNDEGGSGVESLQVLPGGNNGVICSEKYVY